MESFEEDLPLLQLNNGDENVFGKIKMVNGDNQQPIRIFMQFSHVFYSCIQLSQKQKEHKKIFKE